MSDNDKMPGRIDLSSFSSRESAARAVDLALLKIKGDTEEVKQALNFPECKDRVLSDIKSMSIANDEFVEELRAQSQKVQKRV